MRKVLWGVTAFLGFISGINLVFTSLVANGAPQQAAGASLSAAWVVVPYVFCRALDAIARPEKTDDAPAPSPPPARPRGRQDGDFDRDLA